MKNNMKQQVQQMFHATRSLLAGGGAGGKGGLAVWVDGGQATVWW